MKKTLPVMWITLKFIKINRIKTQETRGSDLTGHRIKIPDIAYDNLFFKTFNKPQQNKI